MKNIDQYYMQQTLVLATRGILTVSPNPMVGCIIVKDGLIVGDGWHAMAGKAHAEIYALSKAGEKAKGATAYVTLEPCCHTGRTTPCTDALVKAKVKEVVIATLDPNPKVAGKGIRILKQAGIEVKVGILKNQAKALNKIFFHYYKNHRPFIFAKWAMSLDGKIAVNGNDSKQISSQKAFVKTHQMRNICDAIVIGKDTLVSDNPMLTVRLDLTKTMNPIRFIIFSDLKKINPNWNILNQAEAKTIFVCTKISNIAEVELKKLNIEYWLLSAVENNRVCLKTLIKRMGQIGVTSLLVEGGKKILDSFIDADLINEFAPYICPVLIGNSNPKKHLTFNNVDTLGNDLFINATLNKENTYV